MDRTCPGAEFVLFSPRERQISDRVDRRHLNPVRGCSKVSPGCKHCYAETFAERFRGVPGHPFEQGFTLRTVPEKLNEPLSWRRPRKVFVNSMSDLFHEAVPSDYIASVGIQEAMHPA